MKQQTLFHDTIGLNPAETAKAEATCKAQNELVLKHYKKYAGYWLPAGEVFSYLIRKRLIHHLVPIQSIRRAVTDLTDAGLLIKSVKADKMGPLGKPVHSWTFKITVE